MLKHISAVLLLMMLVALSSCTRKQHDTPLPSYAQAEAPCSALIPEEALTSLPRIYAADGLRALDSGDPVAASDAFNKALKLDLTNSHLQFLNGLAYHLRASAGEGKYSSLARQGYELAVKFDTTNWLAHAYWGLLSLDERHYPQAQEHLAEAVIYNPDDPDLLYALSIASYYSGDLVTADAALRGARKLGLQGDPAVLRASAITSAALDRPEEARAYFDQYQEVEPDTARQQYVAHRIESWERSVGEGILLAQYGMGSVFGDSSSSSTQSRTSRSNSFGGSGSSAPYGGSSYGTQNNMGFVDSKMVMVDVVIIRTEEDISTTRGVNLLTGLKLQFGDPITGTPAFSAESAHTIDRDDSLNDEDRDTVTRYISVPAVSYSLNIFNDQTGRNEILAQPTLIALAGQTSEFFSGTEVSAAAVSGGGGDSVSIEKEIGVKLEVTPEFLPDDLIRLNVTAERTFLTTPSSTVVFEFRLDTSKTKVNANVVMRLGETLILSGLSEKETENNRDGVPFLQDIPGIQYLFSNETHRDFRKSVIILLTPRSTQYVHQAEGNREKSKAEMTEEQRAVTELEDRYADWFQPPPTYAAIFQHMRDNKLYREFRTGDFTNRQWQTQSGHSKRLKRAVEFLYY